MALLLTLVVNAGDGPHAAHIAVGIASVELVLVVEVQTHLQRLFRRPRPLEDLLGPIHAQKSMHFAGLHHLQLGRVPQVVVRFPELQLVARVHYATRIRTLSCANRQARKRPISERCSDSNIEIVIGISSIYSGSRYENVRIIM